jgi:hypothetical protein
VLGGRFGFNLGNGCQVHGPVSQYPSEVPPVSQREVYNTRTKEIQPVMVSVRGVVYKTRNSNESARRELEKSEQGL